MENQFTRKAFSVVLFPALLLSMGGCSTQQVAAPQAQPSSVIESKTPEPTPAVEANAVEPSPVIEPKAMEALEKMSGFLRTLKSYKVSFKVSKDEVLDSGQKVMVDGTSELTALPPSRFHFSTKIDEAHRDQQFFFDGKTFTLYGNTSKFYASVPAPATIRELLDVLEDRYHIELPFADLFIWGTGRADISAIQSAIYIGPTRINEVPCEHYAFRNTDVDWQIWIEQGETPLPRKLVITTKQEEGSPQYVSVMHWNLAPKINNQLFTFVPPKDAYKINFAVNEVATENTK